MSQYIQPPYSDIVASNASRYLRADLTNRTLREYFDGCFRDTIAHYGIYASWACVNCLKQGQATTGWGKKPTRCPECGSIAVYQIATFNAWASKVGDAFAWAFYHLMQERFQIPLVPTPGTTRTHDFEVGERVAIETKGSPSSVINPDGSLYRLGRPGMLRTDTEKKAFDNGRTFRQRNPDGYFCVATNALPPRLEGYRNRDINAIFEVTKVDRINELVREIGTR